MGTPAPEPAADTPLFSQAQLDEQIRRRLDREKATRAKALRDALGIGPTDDPMEALAAVVTERDELRTKLPPEGAKGKEAQRITALEDRIAKQDAEGKVARAADLRRFSDRLLDEAVRGLVASKADTLSADGALLLAPQIRARLRVDDDTMAVIAVDEKGEPALSKDGKPQDTGDVLTELMTKFPSTVRAAGGGSGAHPAGGVPGVGVIELARLKETGSTRDAANAFSALNAKASIVNRP